MLSYALAIAVALSSLVLFLTAFLMSDIHRKDDFLWSAVGLFYALVLWFCARNITGAVLLGQASASVLLVSFVWQTLKLRKAVANPDRAIAISNFSVLQGINGLLKGRKKKPQQVVNTPVTESPDVVTESEISIPETASTEKKLPVIDSKASQKKKSKGSSFGSFFGKKKQSTITNTKLDEILEDEEEVSKSELPKKSDTEPASIPLQTSAENSVSGIKADTKISEETQEKVEEAKSQEIADTTVKDSFKEEPTVDAPKVAEEKYSPETNVDTVIQEVEDSAKEKAPISIKPETSPETEIADSSEDVAKNDSEQAADQTLLEENPVIEEPVTKIVEEKLIIERKTITSSLDSLETVEVAEVLEALPENASGDKDNNSNNIIEVTSTEIDEAVEPQQSDANLKSEEG